MSTNSGIQWTTHTFNPWWGCEKVAQGCKNCYAEGVATRFYGRKVWGPASKTERKIASEKVWHDPQRWNRAAEKAGVRAQVFCLSMGDCLEDHPMLVEPRKRLVGVIESTPWLDWQLLTKRPENADMLGWGTAWPENVWFGASAANQAEYETACRHLNRAHAPLRFLSLEPLIGPIEIDILARMIDWIIVGGESGQGARPCCTAWIDSIVRACSAVDIPCFVKQLGGNPCHLGMLKFHYFKLNDSKGGDMAEWPEDLRVRQMPALSCILADQSANKSGVKQ